MQLRSLRTRSGPEFKNITIFKTERGNFNVSGSATAAARTTVGELLNFQARFIQLVSFFAGACNHGRQPAALNDHLSIFSNNFFNLILL